MNYAIGVASDANYFIRLMRQQLTHIVDRSDSIVAQIDSDHPDPSIVRTLEQYQRKHNDSM